MSSPTFLPRKLLLIIAAVPGFSIPWLLIAMDKKTWPGTAYVWTYPMWTLFLAAPLMLLLTLDNQNKKRAAAWVIACAVVLAAIAAYVGWQAGPHSDFSSASLGFAFVVSVGIGVFKALMYVQHKANQEPLTYQGLFQYSWRNLFTVALALALVAGFSLVLWLWAQLFRVIGIGFFVRTFSNPFVLYPLLSTAFGLGVVIFRNLTGVIDSITRLVEGLIKLLLPLIAALTLGFLATLPFVGLSALWETGHGTALLLWLNVVFLFFVNAVYQSGRTDVAYPAYIHRLVCIGLCALPILSALSFYGLTLRLAQYGWSVERCWAMLIWAVCAAFSLGYAWGVIRRQLLWPKTLARVNTGMGLVILALMFLVNSPLLDFRKISLSSQTARVASGEIKWIDFDFRYVKHHLARPGLEMRQDLLAEIGDTDPVLRERIERPPYMSTRHPEAQEKLWENLVYRPDQFEIPEGLRNALNMLDINTTRQELTLIQTDLDEDGEWEYALITHYKGGYLTGMLYTEVINGWTSRAMKLQDNQWDENLLDIVREANMSTASPRFKNLVIGELEFDVQ